MHLSYSSYIMAENLMKLKQKSWRPLYFCISSLSTMFSYVFLWFSYVLRPSANPLLEISHAFWSRSHAFLSKSYAFWPTYHTLSQSIARGEALSAVHLLYSRAYYLLSTSASSLISSMTAFTRGLINLLTIIAAMKSHAFFDLRL